jgi:hypothetical protein
MVTRLVSRGCAVLALLVQLSTVAACSDDGNFVGPDDGSFQAAVSGGLTRNLSGYAYFGMLQGNPSQPEYFVVDLVHELADENDVPYKISFVRALFGLPILTSYPMSFVDTLEPAPDDFVGFLMQMQGIQSIGTFTSTQGSVTFNSASVQQLQGTFNFSARGAFHSQPNQPITVNVTGTFRAVRGQVLVPRF